MPYQGAVRRWETYWADLDPSIGSEQGGRDRPVLVISNDGFNNAFDVITVISLTKLEGKSRNVYPFEVLLPKGTVTPQWASIVMVQQIRSISKRRLSRPIGALTSQPHRTAIETRLMEHLDIEFEAEGLE